MSIELKRIYLEIEIALDNKVGFFILSCPLRFSPAVS